MNEKSKLEELIKTTNDVRRKYENLREFKSYRDVRLEETFKPLTKELKEIAQNTKEKQELKSDNEEKKDLAAEEHDEDDDDDDDDNNEIFLQYLQLLHNKSESIDNIYGVYFDARLQIYKIGSVTFEFLNGNLNINGKMYPATPGLLQLLFLKKPENQTSDDLKLYLNILEESNVYRRNFDPNQQIKGNNSHKYKQIIKPLIQNKRSGNGLMNLPKDNIDYIYWDDPNEVVDRLRLLISSQQAGHNNHNNEILSILEELREANIII